MGGGYVCLERDIYTYCCTVSLNSHKILPKIFHKYFTQEVQLIVTKKVLVYMSDFLVFVFFFLGPPLRHMAFSRLGVKSELQLPAYTTTTAPQDPSLVCNLHHSSQQCQILNSLSEARDQTHNLMVPSLIHFCCTTTGTPICLFFTRN